MIYVCTKRNTHWFLKSTIDVVTDHSWLLSHKWSPASSWPQQSQDTLGESHPRTQAVFLPSASLARHQAVDTWYRHCLLWASNICITCDTFHTVVICFYVVTLDIWCLLKKNYLCFCIKKMQNESEVKYRNISKCFISDQSWPAA